MTEPEKTFSRIQLRNRKRILDAALEVFSQNGFRGSTLDQIASEAGLSKPNLIYYFSSKEDIHRTLLVDLLDIWLQPLRDINANGEPREELLQYVQRKLQMSKEMPRESRLFANETLQGAPRLTEIMEGGLKDLVDEKAAIIEGWIAEGKIAKVDPVHLIFSIWALTQHYADFEVQIRAILGKKDPFKGAEIFLDMVFRKLLDPNT
ncbi:MAG: TetR family transcriptional regulator C-terminal domain-containing protein [Pseudomonadota bacterium]|nr:TetR family transcriptional regulator C-terminal domain-containing protein [Pseudomonadota bacterium]